MKQCTVVHIYSCGNKNNYFVVFFSQASNDTKRMLNMSCIYGGEFSHMWDKNAVYHNILPLDPILSLIGSVLLYSTHL
jgi:hypothetical protein